jgi:xanthine dehydrogenase accessory factor
VSLALCDVLSKLDFELHVFDDRVDLNTMEAITTAHNKTVINYAQSTDFIPDEEQIYVILISFGYRTDEEILRSIYGRKFKYLGMMGSPQKIQTMRDKLLGEGFDRKYFDSIYTPIGLPIHSQTTYEIAISIAAQMIMVKNSQW